MPVLSQGARHRFREGIDMSEIARITPATEPEVFRPRPPAPDVDSWIGVVAEVSKLASFIAPTEFVPKGLRGSAPAVAAAILYGREVHLPPMTALTQTYVIDGKPSISAEAMRALVLAAGHHLVFVETTGAICTMRARRNGDSEWTALTWTIDMARAAGLLGSSAWKSYPRAMLQARCTTEIARMVFPDVIHGFRSTEELEDMAAGGGVPAPAEPVKRATVQRASRKRATSGEEAAAAPALPAAVAPEEPSAPGQSAFVPPPLPGEPGYDMEPRGRDGLPRVPSPAQTGGGVGAPDAVPEDRDTDPTPAPDEPEEPVQDQDGDRPIPRSMVTAIQARFGELGLGGRLLEDRRKRLGILETIVNRPIESTNGLTYAEGHLVLDTLARVESAAQLQALLAEVIAAGVEATTAAGEPEPEEPEDES
jgi:hypothetical protein